MSSGPCPADIAEALQQVAELAGAQDVRIAVIGAQARIARGSPETSAAIDIAASGPLQIAESTPLHLGGQAFGIASVAVHWLVRADEYAALYAAVMQGAEQMPGWPAPIARADHLAATLLATRRQEDHARIVGLFAAGHFDPDAARAAVREHLGPYAIADLETLVQEAEWQAMRQKFGSDGSVH